MALGPRPVAGDPQSFLEDRERGKGHRACSRCAGASVVQRSPDPMCPHSAWISCGKLRDQASEGKAENKRSCFLPGEGTPGLSSLGHGPCPHQSSGPLPGAVPRAPKRGPPGRCSLARQTGPVSELGTAWQGTGAAGKGDWLSECHPFLLRPAGFKSYSVQDPSFPVSALALRQLQVSALGSRAPTAANWQRQRGMFIIFKNINGMGKCFRLEFDAFDSFWPGCSVSS